MMKRCGRAFGVAVWAGCLITLVSLAWARAGAARRDAALLTAVRAGDVAGADALLRRGAHVEARSHAATDADWQEDGYTPLALAVARDDAPMVRLLLSHGADVRATAPAQGNWPPRDIVLCPAAGVGDVAVLRLLLARGAPVEANGGMGVTPLWLAARYGRVGAVRVLLGAGADPDARDERGFTPVSAAQANHHGTVIRLLQRASTPGKRA